MDELVTRFLGFLRTDANVESRSEELGDTSFADVSSSPNLTGDMESQRTELPNDGLPDDNLTDGNEVDTPDNAADDVLEEVNEQDATEEEAEVESPDTENILQAEDEESLDESIEESLESSELETEDDYENTDESSDDDGLAEDDEDTDEDVLDENIYSVHDWETSFDSHYEDELGQSVDADNIDYYDVQDERAYEEDETYVSAAEDQEDEERWDELALADLAQDVLDVFSEHIQSVYMQDVLELDEDYASSNIDTEDAEYININPAVDEEDIPDLIA
jgi:hypothetical protein